MMLGQSYLELDSSKFQIEGIDYFHFFLDKIFTRSGDVESSINPDDARRSSQSKCSPKPSRDTGSTVAVKKFQINSSTGETKYN